MISFSDPASEEIRNVIGGAGDDCAGLRIRALRLGQYTFRYQLHLVRQDDTRDEDSVVEQPGFKVYLDPQTSEWMDGATVNFLTGEAGTGFAIDNPAANPNWDDPVAQKVQQVIDEKILPSLAAHGGWVELSGVEGETAYVVLGGGCQGCASAGETLKHGIEAAIVNEVPEITKVEDKTDHASGTAPHCSA